ncbi:MAG: hypothetical protein PUP91_13790 [Rhizonema sp. PD37]|nr:hypothetical protein [Rhizonema sp. PD37]
MKKVKVILLGAIAAGITLGFTGGLLGKQKSMVTAGACLLGAGAITQTVVMATRRAAAKEKA